LRAGLGFRAGLAMLAERPSHSDSRTMNRPDDNAMIARSRHLVLDLPVRGKVDVSQALVFRS
jgi:hypothetical protein